MPGGRAPSATRCFVARASARAASPATASPTSSGACRSAPLDRPSPRSSAFAQKSGPSSAAAASRQPGAPSTSRSRSPVSPNAPRASLREHARFLLERTRPLEWWGLFLRACFCVRALTFLFPALLSPFVWRRRGRGPGTRGRSWKRTGQRTSVETAPGPRSQVPAPRPGQFRFPLNPMHVNCHAACTR